MIRDDLVKQLEKAEQIAAATRGQHISISFPAIEAVFRANEALHIWDMAYAAGAKDEREACAKVIENDCHDDMTRAEEAAAIRARGEK
jgi:outer membrane protein assembly factor BamD (BamD/ComL family)